MPLAINVGDILSARAWCQLDEQGSVNTYNYYCTSKAGSGGTDQDLASAFDFIISGFYKALCPATVEYRGTQVYFLKSFFGVLIAPVSSIANAGVGTATGNPCPRNTCPVMKYNTSSRGPGGRGRLFMPFCATSFVASNGRPTVGLETLMNSTASALLSPLIVGSGGNTSTLEWSLIRKHKGAVPTLDGTIINALSADKFGQQHRRGDYGRANASPI